MYYKTASLSVVVGVLLVLTWLRAGAQQANAPEPNRAGLVVQLDDVQVVTHCVEFAEPEIDGYDLLVRSGLEVVINSGAGVGATVCKIGDSGCPAEDCWCQCQNLAGSCTYWSYWHLRDGVWVYSSVGVTGYRIRPGDVEGWRWGTAGSPPAIAFDQICAPPASDTPTPSPTWTPSPTATPTATWTATPQPTASSTPEATPTFTPLPPTATPLPSATRTPVAAFASAPTATRSSPRLPAPTATFAPSAMPPAADTPHPTGTLTSCAAEGTVASASSPTVSPQPSPLPSATATLESVPSPAPAPTRVAIITRAAAATQAETAAIGQDGDEVTTNRSLITALSIGVGVAYAFFVLFVVLLAGLFVVVRSRQR